MNFSSTVFAVCISATIACTGTVEDGTNHGAADPAVAPENAAFEQASEDPRDRSEGDDPGFEGASADAPTEDPAPPGAPAGELLAKEAARELMAMTVSVYDHTTYVDESTGTYRYDCSGFVAYALSRALPTQLEAVRVFAGGKRPSAAQFEQFFESITSGAAGGWSRIGRAIDVRAGDVVAWVKPADLVSTNTGHVMIVAGAPAMNPARPEEILVPITDSTSSFHGPADTRAASASTGLGRGTIGVIVDAKGAPLRYRWTGSYSTKEYATAIAFGRPD